MNCKKTQKFIGSYIDGELDRKRSVALKEHIKICQTCSELEKNIRELAVLPFENLRRVKPPEDLWLKIEKRLPKPESNRFIFKVVNQRTLFSPVLKPAFALIILIIISTFSFSHLTKINPKDKRLIQISSYLNQGIDLDSIFDETDKKIMPETLANSVDLDQKNDLDFGTDIEKYFL